MRPAVRLLAAFLALSSAAFAQGVSPSTPAASSTPPAPVAKPAEKAAPKPEPKPEEIQLPGVVINRPDGRFLSVETEGVTVKITFYNQEKKKETADVIRISARWTDSQPRFAVLLPSAPETLSSPGVFKRPFNYLVYLALVGGDETVKESYSLRLQ